MIKIKKLDSSLEFFSDPKDITFDKLITKKINEVIDNVNEIDEVVIKHSSQIQKLEKDFRDYKSFLRNK